MKDNRNQEGLHGPQYAAKKARIEHPYAIVGREAVPGAGDPEVIFCARRPAGFAQGTPRLPIPSSFDRARTTLDAAYQATCRPRLQKAAVVPSAAQLDVITDVRSGQQG